MAESEWLDKYFRPLVRSEGAVNLTDDVATLSSDTSYIVTTDTIVEGVHFLSTDPMDSVGQKIVTVNVSDILAKGAYPTEAVLNLTWNTRRSETDLKAFISGFRRMLKDCEVELIGGDTTIHEGGVVVSMTLHGRCISDSPIRRSTGKVRDLVWVTGTIGASGLGLKSLKGDPLYDDFVKFYQYPLPPKRIIADSIAEFANASMDVSDGLLLDVSRLASVCGCGVVLEIDKVPMAIVSDNLEFNLEQCTSGDDYQVLFTTSSTHSQALLERSSMEKWSVTCIGTLQPELGLRISVANREIPLPDRLGYVHSSTV